MLILTQHFNIHLEHVNINRMCKAIFPLNTFMSVVKKLKYAKFVKY